MGKRGQYKESDKELIYQKILEMSKKQLKHHSSVIVDGTFYKEELRNQFLDLSNELAVPIRWIEVTADEEVIKERISKKRKYSEADFSVYEIVKASFDPLENDHLKLNSSELELDKMVELAMNYIEV